MFNKYQTNITCLYNDQKKYLLVYLIEMLRYFVLSHASFRFSFRNGHFGQFHGLHLAGGISDGANTIIYCSPRIQNKNSDTKIIAQTETDIKIQHKKTSHNKNEKLCDIHVNFEQCGRLRDIRGDRFKIYLVL